MKAVRLKLKHRFRNELINNKRYVMERVDKLVKRQDFHLIF